MLSDIDIAKAAVTQPITSIASQLGLGATDVLPYGHDKAKLSLSILNQPRQLAEQPKLVLVTAISPTPAGEGKTTTSIGLGMGLAPGNRFASHFESRA